MQSGVAIKGKLLSKNGETTHDSFQKTPVILYYFSAHWCPPCKKFTPMLVEWYNQWNKDSKKVEIIFLSLDKTEGEFKEYYATMPWLAVPFGDSRVSTLKSKFGLQGIPFLVQVDCEENLLNDECRDEVLANKGNVLDDWIKLNKKVFFQGEGTSLGGSTQSSLSSGTKFVPADLPKADDSKPKTNIVLKLASGDQKEIEVNMDTKVATIYNYVAFLSKDKFELSAGFPPKPLTDMNATVEEAGLDGSKVT